MRFDTDARVSQLGISRMQLVLAALTLGMGPVALVNLNDGSSLGEVSSFWLFLAAVVLAGYLATRATRPREAPGHRLRPTQADETGLHIDGKLVLARAKIRAAYIFHEDATRSAVRVEGGTLDRDYVLHLDSESACHALVAALRLDPTSACARFNATTWFGRLPAFLLAFGATFATVAIGLSADSREGPLLSVLFAAVVTLLVGPLFAAPVRIVQRALRVRVEIGQDGIRRGTSARGLIPIADIVGVIPTSTGVEVERSGGRRTEIVLGPLNDQTAKAAYGLRRCIDRARGAADMHAHVEQEALLVRGGRPRQAWEDAARAIGAMTASDAQGYRAPPLSRDTLWAILESGRADSSAREGATIALSASLDDAERKRMRSLARRTVVPSLRARLETLGERRHEPRIRVDADDVRRGIAREQIAQETHLHDVETYDENRYSANTDSSEKYERRKMSLDRDA